MRPSHRRSQCRKGIGFAIPLAHIEEFLSYWLKPEHFSDAFLGIAADALVTSPAEETGVLLPAVLPESPLAQGGLKEGDRVIAVNGQPVTCPLDFGRALWTLHAGDALALETPSGTHAVTVGTQDDVMLIRTRLGISLEPLTPALRTALRLRPDQQGLVISEVQDEAPGSIQGAQWRQVLRRGDIVLQFAEQEYPTLAQLGESLRESHAGEFRYAVFYAGSMNMPVEVSRLQLN